LNALHRASLAKHIPITVLLAQATDQLCSRMLSGSSVEVAP
jgi:hypothetical protein